MSVSASVSATRALAASTPARAYAYIVYVCLRKRFCNSGAYRVPAGPGEYCDHIVYGCLGKCFCISFAYFIPIDRSEYGTYIFGDCVDIDGPVRR